MMTQGELGFKYEEDKQGDGMTGLDGCGNDSVPNDAEPGGGRMRGRYGQTGIG
jgi:hypothetical protein